MPFFKLFTTIMKIARKHLTPSVAFRVINSEEPITLNVRHMYRWIKVWGVDICSMFDFNNCVGYIHFILYLIDYILITSRNFVVIKDLIFYLYGLRRSNVLKRWAILPILQRYAYVEWILQAVYLFFYWWLVNPY